MTDKEMKKVKDSLPEWDKQNEAEKKLDRELACREMINSILIYGYLDNTIDEIYEDKYLRNYKKDISEERIKELIKEQQEDLKKSKINNSVYTDDEGVTYNSVSWYDEDEEKELNENYDNEDLTIYNIKEVKPNRYKTTIPSEYEEELKELGLEYYFYSDSEVGPESEDIEYLDVYFDKDKINDIIKIKKKALNDYYSKYNKNESKELRKYNSRLYGVYDTEKQEYTDTGTLEDMKNEVENEKEDIEEKQEEPKEDKKDININITVKNESLNDKNKILSKVFANYPDISEEDEDYLNGLSLEELIIELRSRGWEDLIEENKEIKKVKTESLEEESINPIINPDDRYYYDDHLWVVYLYPGAGVELIPYYVYADYEQEALDILLPYLLENALGLVYDVSDLEDDDLDNYMSIDGNYYLDYNTRIEEIEGEEKEKIEKEFFKNYKEED